MLDTYIKNKGITKTIVHDNLNNDNTTDINEIKWDAEYDGDIANIDLDINTNGENKHYNFKIDNDDLDNILNVSSIDLLIDKRLIEDFKKKKIHNYKQPQIIEIDNNSLIPFKNSNYNLPSEETSNKNLINESNHNNYKTHISSPLSNKEIIIPLTIDRNPTSNSYALTHKKRHKHPRTHKTHKIYKHSISSKHKNKHHNKKKSKSSKLISRASTKRSKNYLSTFF